MVAMKPERILVTGGAEFLGSHLCERLVADGHNVICIDDLFTGRRVLDSHNFEFSHSPGLDATTTHSQCSTALVAGSSGARSNRTVR